MSYELSYDSLRVRSRAMIHYELGLVLLVIMSYV